MEIDLNKINHWYKKLFHNLESVILGKELVLKESIMALICRGHILVEDVPGTGKTVLAKAIALSINSQFNRIQFTPDMLPSDITGTSIFNQKNNSFEFRHGPIMANIILADEINRATPKTQSALLEAMEERQITVDGKTFKLPDVFMVIATQNPIEYEGTYALPEAQLDRFIVKISIGYPSNEIEAKILSAQQELHPIELVKPVTDVQEIIAIQSTIRKIFVSEPIKKYIVDIINKTRTHESVYLGASPRGALALFRLGQCSAAFNGRDFVIPDDIKSVVIPAIAHRILLKPDAKIKDIQPSDLLDEILSMIKIPI
jgi:MoxR-like ATPase